MRLVWVEIVRQHPSSSHRVVFEISVDAELTELEQALTERRERLFISRNTLKLKSQLNDLTSKLSPFRV